jgi:hypothetical protein
MRQPLRSQLAYGSAAICRLKGTAGQPQQLYPGMGFFLIEDVPEELAVATVEFIGVN